MPVLGVGGKLVLQREAPEPCILPAEQLNTGIDSFASVCPGYWTGDHVAVNCLPINIPGVLPGDPKNWATYYGSKWFLGPNRSHITDSEDKFYKSLGTPGADYSGTVFNNWGFDENITNPSDAFDGDNATYAEADNNNNTIHVAKTFPPFGAGDELFKATTISLKVAPNHYVWINGSDIPPSDLTPSVDYSGTVLNQTQDAFGFDENIVDAANAFDGDSTTYAKANNATKTIHVMKSDMSPYATPSTSVSVKVNPNYWVVCTTTSSWPPTGPASEQKTQVNASGVHTFNVSGYLVGLRVSPTDPDGPDGPAAEVRLYSVAIDGTTLVDVPSNGAVFLQADGAGNVSTTLSAESTITWIRISNETASPPVGPQTPIRLYSITADGTTLVDGPPVAAECYPDGQCGDAAQFYARIGDTSGGDTIEGCSPGDYWIHIDQLGRLSFYDSRCKALAGCPSDRLDLIASSEDVVIAPYGRLDYQNAVWECYSALQGSYEYSDVRDPTTLISICADAPRYEIPEANPNTEEFAYNNANVLPRGGQQQAPYYQCVADLREYSLDLLAPEVDCTAVAEKFGNAVKSLVSGGGSCEFFIDRKCFDDETTNGISLMQLLLMTERGCKASAQFYLMQRPGDCGADPCSGLISGDFYYEADILVTQTAVNVRPTELVVGTANFVTTGEIALREAY